MGETIIRIKLSELDTVRVKCKKCDGTIEVSLNKLGTIGRGNCPLCRHEWYNASGGVNDRLADFATVASSVLQVDNMEIEFVIPQSRLSN